MSSQISKLSYYKHNITLSESGHSKVFPDTSWEYFLYTFIGLVLLISIILCVLCVKVIWRSLSISRRSAYGNLVKSDFFKKWEIRDLNGITYHPTGPRGQLNNDPNVLGRHNGDIL
jgi:hypothetical protein